MASITIGVGYTFEYIDHGGILGDMTRLAFHFGVLASQGIIRFIVIKVRGRRKGLHIVARLALGRQGVLVMVGMTKQTFRGQTEVSRLSLCRPGVYDEVRFMAIFTVLLFMGPFQGVAREAMIEIIGVKPDHFEAPSMVFAVTGKTVLSSDLC
jgi:hypothetical protein